MIKKEKKTLILDQFIWPYIDAKKQKPEENFSFFSPVIWSNTVCANLSLTMWLLTKVTNWRLIKTFFLAKTSCYFCEAVFGGWGWTDGLELNCLSDYERNLQHIDLGHNSHGIK